MTTLPAIRDNNQQLAIPTGFGVEGLENLDQQDIILPRWTIVQLTSKGKGEEYGHFHNNLTQETTPVLRAVILRINRSRTLWSGDLADGKPECSSYDGVTSRDGRDCAPCDYNRWGSEEDKHVCKAGYTLLCVSPETEEMFLLGAMGTSVRPAKILISQFAMKKRPPFSAVTEFLTAKVEDTKGKYYVLKPVVSAWLEPAEVARYRAVYLGMQDVTIQEVEPEAAAMGEDDLPF